MAIVEMKRLTLLAPKADRDKLLRALQRLGCVEITAPQADEETADALYEAVRRLPDREHTVILLRYMQDMPVEEIAEALGLSPSAVYRRLETAETDAGRRRHSWMRKGCVTR